jgi:hypothetical protein
MELSNREGRCSSNILLNYHLTLFYSGSITQFTNSGFYATWNTSRPCPTHVNNCLKCGQQIISAIERLNNRNEKHKLPMIQVGIAMASDHALCGNMGNKTMRRYAVVGNIMARVNCLQVLNRSFHTKFIIDKTVKTNNKGILTRPIDQFYTGVANEESHTFVAYEYADQKQEAADEWMYEMEAKQHLDMYNQLDKAFEFYLEHKYKEAEEILTEYLAENTSDTITNRLLNRVKGCISGTAVNFTALATEPTVSHE